MLAELLITDSGPAMFLGHFPESREGPRQMGPKRNAVTQQDLRVPSGSLLNLTATIMRDR